MVKSLILLGGLALLSVPAVWAAAPPKAGPPFPLSSCTDCLEREPAVAVAPNGDFFAAWQGKKGFGQEGVPGRAFHANAAPLAAEFSLVGSTGAEALDVDLAASRNDVVAVWSEGGRIFAQRLGFAGDRLGDRIQVSLDDAQNPNVRHVNPAVARAADGSFVVAWVRFSVGGSNDVPRILARRFNATGVPRTGAVRVSTGLANDSRPDLCVDTSGRSIVVWTNVDDFRPFLSNKKGVSSRRLGVNLGPLEGERIVAPPDNDESSAAISCGRGNTYVIAWQSEQSREGDRSEILAKRYTRLGRPVGGTLVVNQSVEGVQKQPAIAHEPSGAFTVAWASNGFDDRGLVARRFSAPGAPLSNDFQIASEVDTSLARPSLAYAADGRAVVVWQDGTSGVFGQRFSPAQ